MVLINSPCGVSFTFSSSFHVNTLACWGVMIYSISHCKCVAKMLPLSHQQEYEEVELYELIPFRSSFGSIGIHRAVILWKSNWFLMVGLTFFSQLHWCQNDDGEFHLQHVHVLTCICCKMPTIGCQSRTEPAVGCKFRPI